jgi:hypothetical protein
MRLDAAANFETIDLIERVIRPNCGELQDLVVEGVAARCFGVVENEIHDPPAAAGKARSLSRLAAAGRNPFPIARALFTGI